MESFKALLSPGFQSKPWAEISERFQRIKGSPARDAKNKYISQRFQRIKCSPVRDGKTKYISERFQR